MGKDMINYLLDLCKDGGTNESLKCYSDAYDKYECGMFVLDEIKREMYHRSKFVSEDLSS